MKRRFSIALLMPLLVFCHLQVYSQNPSIKLITQDIWAPGHWWKVDIQISVGQEMGPCRLTQTFPVGFKVRGESLADGDLFFENNTLNVVWTKLSGVNSFTVSYSVMPEELNTGSIDIGGEFYFVNTRNQRRSVSIPEKSVIIDASGTVKPSERQATITETAVNQDNDNKDNNALIYRIQVLSSSSKLSEQELKKRLGISFQEKVTVVVAGSIYKYQIGSFSSVEGAQQLLQKFKTGGVSEAFVVAYENGNQITIEQAKAIRK